MNDRCIMNSEQQNLFTYRWPRSRTIRRAVMFQTLEAAVDWPLLEGMVRPYYEADQRKTGRRGYSLRMLIRLLIVQHLWRLSDRELEIMVHDSHSVCKFAGLDPWNPKPPSPAKIADFRGMLERRAPAHPADPDGRRTLMDAPDPLFSLRTDLLDAFHAQLDAAGLELRPGHSTDPALRRKPGTKPGGGE